jgi:hypothetical protein
MADVQAAHEREDAGAVVRGQLGEQMQQLAGVVGQLGGHVMQASNPRAAELPFPDSLCHTCAAPPRYVRTNTSIFIMCPLVPAKYPPQPVRACPLYRPRPQS